MSFSHPLYERLKQFQFVLASTSPRRLEILEKNLQIKDIEIMPSNFEENLLKEEHTCQEYVSNTSLGKGQAVVKQLISQNGPSSIILSSDTIVTCNQEVFEKPQTKERQLEMFHKYHQHPDLEVITSVNIIKYDSVTKESIIKSAIEITKLRFNDELSDEFLKYYVDSEEGLHVAGGFKYQELGCLLFKSIDGDYFNIVGLPAGTTFRLLSDILQPDH
ncbi:unnamed protein product [Debaryomyces fabryi]|nr:unnamed protein product [Debaryomyces fabryi]